jgi:hypothetical protein
VAQCSRGETRILPSYTNFEIGREALCHIIDLHHIDEQNTYLYLNGLAIGLRWAACEHRRNEARIVFDGWGISGRGNATDREPCTHEEQGQDI